MLRRFATRIVVVILLALGAGSAFAIDNAGNEEAVKVTTYVIDDIAPTTTIMPPGGKLTLYEVSAPATVISTRVSCPSMSISAVARRARRRCSGA